MLKNKKAFLVLLTSVALFAPSLAIANGPGGNIKQPPAATFQKCMDMNSMDCVASESTDIRPDKKNPRKPTKKDGEEFATQLRVDLKDSSEIDQTPGATSYCVTPDGQRIPHASGVRYFFFPKSTNCERDSEIRECRFGVLDGTATLLSCVPFRDCNGPGYNIRHGQSGTFSNAARSSACQTETRTCNDGVLSGNPALTFVGSCVPFNNCTHHGVTIGHGSSRVFYRVSESATCASEATTVSCNDGAVSGSNLGYTFTTCSAPPPPPADCPSRTLDWNAGGSACSSTASAATSGQTRTLNSSNANTGSATFACSNGSWIQQPGATCAARPPSSCSSQMVNWSVNGVSCSGPTGALSNGQVAAVRPTNDRDGDARFLCSGGSWLEQSGSTCSTRGVATCAAESKSWTSQAGHVCTASTALSSIGNVQTLTSRNQNSGTARYTCSSSGSWSGPDDPTCNPPAVTTCPSGDRAWTVGQATCSAPNQTAGKAGDFITLNSSNGMNGRAGFTCTNGSWTLDPGATCSPRAEPKFNPEDPLSCNSQDGTVTINSTDMRTDITRTGNRLKVTYGTASNGTRGDYWNTGHYPRTLNLNISDASRISRAVLAYREWDDQFSMAVNGQIILAHGNTGYFRESPGATMIYDEGRALYQTYQYQNAGHGQVGKMTGGFNGVPVFHPFIMSDPRLSKIGIEFFTGYNSSTPIDIRHLLRNGNNQIEFTTYVEGGGEGYYEIEFDLSCQGQTPPAATPPPSRPAKNCPSRTMTWFAEYVTQGADGPESNGRFCSDVAPQGVHGQGITLSFENRPYFIDHSEGGVTTMEESGSSSYTCIDGTWSNQLANPISCSQRRQPQPDLQGG